MRNKPAPPKEPRLWKYPRMYIVMDRDTGDLGSIIRTVFPNGRGDYSELSKGPEAISTFDFACWEPSNHDHGFSDDTIDVVAAELARASMMSYVSHKYPHMMLLYIGEIK